MSRYTNTGNDKPYIVAPGYKHASRYDVPLSRDPELTPFGFAKSLAACLLLIAAAWGLIIAFS